METKRVRRKTKVRSQRVRHRGREKVGDVPGVRLPKSGRTGGGGRGEEVRGKNLKGGARKGAVDGEEKAVALRPLILILMIIFPISYP